MSQESVEVVERAIASVNARDIEAYLACCTEDIELHTPWAPVSGVYEGPVGIRRFFADVEDAGRDFHLNLECIRAVGTNQVLTFMNVTATGRASGVPSATPTANLYDVANGKIRRLRIFADRQQALEAAGLRA